MRDKIRLVYPRGMIPVGPRLELKPLDSIFEIKKIEACLTFNEDTCELIKEPYDLLFMRRRRGKADGDRD